MEIRKGVPDDFAEVYRMILDFAVFIQKPEYVDITPEQMLADKDHFQCLVALDGDKIFGFATFFFRLLFMDG